MDGAAASRLRIANRELSSGARDQFRSRICSRSIIVSIAVAVPVRSLHTASESVVESSDPLGALVRDAARGDSRATAKLLRTLAPPVHRAVRAILGRTHPDVDDVAQNALVAIARSLPQFRGECRVARYANLIAIRHAIEARRQNLARAGHEEPLSEDWSDDAGVNPSDEVLRSQRRRLLRQLLAELPESQAEVLALRVVLGHSLEETARMVGAPVNTVRSRLRLAREALLGRIVHDRELCAALEVDP